MNCTITHALGERTHAGADKSKAGRCKGRRQSQNDVFVRQSQPVTDPSLTGWNGRLRVRESINYAEGDDEGNDEENDQEWDSSEKEGVRVLCKSNNNNSTADFRREAPQHR